MPTPLEKQLAIQRAVFIGFAYFLVVISGIAAEYALTGRDEFFLPVVLAFTLVLACVTDARLIQRPIPRIIQFVMLLTSPLAVPVYCLYARRGRGLLWLLFFSITLTITYVIAIVVVIAITEIRGG